MSAGTVISGGFPGRVAQEVQPNHKCEGCLHYDRQAGRTGACLIGDRPWNCGEGDAPDIGYAPIARGAGSYLPDMSNHGAHAPEVDTQHVGRLYGAASTRPVEIRQVSLGEEHVHLVKSMVEGHTRFQKSQCHLCSMQGTRGTAPANVGYQVCTCEPILAETVAKAVVSRMSNAARASNTFDDVVGWVRDVAKAGFRLPTMAKALTFRPHPESPKNMVATTSHGEYEISPTGTGEHRLDYYIGAATHPGHTERFRSRAAAVRHANWHHSKLTAAGVK